MVRFVPDKQIGIVFTFNNNNTHLYLASDGVRALTFISLPRMSTFSILQLYGSQIVVQQLRQTNNFFELKNIHTCTI